MSPDNLKTPMQSEQRRFIRFSLDIPAVRHTRFGDRIETVLLQISLGGCLLEWDESVITGEEFRLLIQLPSKNFLPLTCKALYKSENVGIGAKFLDITRFEQELISKIISQTLTNDGLPLQVDPFQTPPSFSEFAAPRLTDVRVEREKVIDDVLSHDS